MKSEDKEVDINEVAIALEVDSDVIDKVRSGEVTHIVLQINEQNQNMILESIDGDLVLVIDDIPTTYHALSALILNLVHVSVIRVLTNPSWKTPTATVVYGKLILKWCLCLLSLGII